MNAMWYNKTTGFLLVIQDGDGSNLDDEDVGASGRPYSDYTLPYAFCIEDFDPKKVTDWGTQDELEYDGETFYAADSAMQTFYVTYKPAMTGRKMLVCALDILGFADCPPTGSLTGDPYRNWRQVDTSDWERVIPPSYEEVHENLPAGITVQKLCELLQKVPPQTMVYALNKKGEYRRLESVDSDNAHNNDILLTGGRVE